MILDSSDGVTNASSMVRQRDIPSPGPKLIAVSSSDNILDQAFPIEEPIKKPSPVMSSLKDWYQETIRNSKMFMHGDSDTPRQRSPFPFIPNHSTDPYTHPQNLPFKPKAPEIRRLEAFEVPKTKSAHDISIEGYTKYVTDILKDIEFTITKFSVDTLDDSYEVKGEVEVKKDYSEQLTPLITDYSRYLLLKQFQRCSFSKADKPVTILSVVAYK